MTKKKKNVEGADENATKEYREVYLYDKQSGAYGGPYDATDGDPDLVFTEDKPDYPETGQTMVYRGGKWQSVPTASVEAWTKAIAQRNRFLSASDWTQLKDIPEEISAEWAEYRQKLRDLPKEEGFPEVEFPTAPAI